MERPKEDERPMIIAMKGHPGTGKSTLAYSLAKTLKCPLIDKDHFKDCTKSLQESLNLTSNNSISSKLLNDLSYEVMWNMASTQISLGLNVVIDSPLSRKAHLDRLVELAGRDRARVFIVECRPSDETEWRRRIEQRGATSGSSWHKPKNWEEIETLLDGYGGCWDYDVGQVPRLFVDTTASVGVEEMVSLVLNFIQDCKDRGSLAGGSSCTTATCCLLGDMLTFSI